MARTPLIGRVSESPNDFAATLLPITKGLAMSELEDEKAAQAVADQAADDAADQAADDAADQAIDDARDAFYAARDEAAEA